MMEVLKALSDPIVLMVLLPQGVLCYFIIKFILLSKGYQKTKAKEEAIGLAFLTYIGIIIAIFVPRAVKKKEGNYSDL